MSGSGPIHPVHVRIALTLIRIYRLLFSSYFAGSCRFLPSCADYAAGAIARHGVVRGGWLAVRRLSRCHPLCDAGHDPVPETTASRVSGFSSVASSFSRTK